jgi:hypothetical protein
VDGALAGSIVAAVAGAVPATIGALALLRKAMQNDMAARRWVQTVIDLVSAGVVYGIPLSVLARGRRIVEEQSGDDEPHDPPERRPAADDPRRATGDDDRDPGDLRGVVG